MLGLLPYFPRLSFLFNALEKGDIPVHPFLQYDKKWHVNRTVIPGSNGLITLSIPIEGGRNSKSNFDYVKIDNRYHWQRDHFRTLVSVYGSSPYFKFYEPELKKLMDAQHGFLMEWNRSCLEWVLLKLKMDHLLKSQFHQQFSADIHPTEFHQKDAINPIQQMVKSSFRYQQVFEDKIGFMSDLSVIDLLFNIGPDAHQKIMTQLVKL